MTEALGGPSSTSGTPESGGRVETDAPATPRRFPCFDGLRAIAALLVLLIHTAWTSGFTSRTSLGIYTSRLEIGVAVFFLISGFLLYRPFAVSHLAGGDPIDTWHFWGRRLLRIVPAYWLALTILTYVLHDVSMGPGWKGVASHYLFLQIYLPSQWSYGIQQAWSLCIEMSFYLFLPLYARLLTWRRRTARSQVRRELLGLGVLTAVSLGYRWWSLHLPGALRVTPGGVICEPAPQCLQHLPLVTLVPGWLPGYLDLFAFGMLLAVLSAWWTTTKAEPRWLSHGAVPWLCWAGAALAFWTVSHLGISRIPLYVTAPGTNLLRQELYGLFALLLLVPAVAGPQDRSPIRRFLRSWPVASFGVISYGIYLWHQGMIDELMKWTGWTLFHAPFGAMVTGVLGLTIAVASVSYFGLERPVLHFKRRLGWWRRVPAVQVGAVRSTPDTARGPDTAPTKT